MTNQAVEDYIALIAPEHHGKPKFAATVALTVAPLVGLQEAVSSLPADFDLDDAIGAQLDIVGQWVGISRDVLVPIANVWFSFGDAARGFGRGFWKGPYAQNYGIQSFDDDTYRRLIRAKIMANAGHGTVTSALAILNQFLMGSGATFFVYGEDEGLSGAPAAGATLHVGFVGDLPSFVYMLVIAREYLPIRGSGIALDVKGTTVRGSPLFGFGIQNEYIAGFGAGAWGASPDALIQLSP